MRTIFCIISLLQILQVFSQITYKNNCVRSGDEIIKQQVEYKDPGREGENVIWDFSKLESINDEYILTYNNLSLINDSLYLIGYDTLRTKDVDANSFIIGLEHQTKYFYQNKDEYQYLLGHENRTTFLKYKQPLPVILSQLDYQQNAEIQYQSEALYSNKLWFHTKGNYKIDADATGIMILPNQDTLYHVTRVKTKQTFIQTDTVYSDKENMLDMYVNNYKWYAKGYRYPIFETIHTVNIIDNNETNYYQTAFFYPPIDHYYMDNDLDNLAVLDSLNKEHKDTNIPISWIQENFSYNYGPNPISGTLAIEYHLKQNATVGITLYSSTHGIVKTIPPKNRQKGLYSETLDCHGLYPDTYILKFDVKDESINSIIIKK